MSTVPQKPSQGSSQIAKVDRAQLVAAFKAKTILDAFEQPTVAMAVKSLGSDQVLIQMTAHITKAFTEYFSESQRMDPEMHVAFAETIMEDYPHESLADVVLFIKYAARGRYGETKEDGTIVNKGKTFGRLTTTTAMDWFGQYLGEKADAVAERRIAMNKEVNENGFNGRGASILHDTVLSVVKKAHAEARKDEDLDTGRRVAQLTRTVQHMGVDRLRHAYNKAKTERERMVVLHEANRRGLVQKRIEEHLKNKKQ